MNQPNNPNAPHDLVVVACADAVLLIRADARTSRPLLRLPTGQRRKPLLSGVLSRLIRENRPSRVVLTVLSDATLADVVDSVVVTLEDFCEEARIPLVWLPNLTEVAASLRELGTDLANEQPERQVPRH